MLNDVTKMEERNYIQGKTIERFGSLYLIEKVYQLSDEFMKMNHLQYKNRVTLRKITGENGMEIMDFAINEI